jgi:hypothetical protein
MRCVLISANVLKSCSERADTGVDEGGIFLGHRQGPRPASHSPPGGLVASPDTSRDWWRRPRPIARARAASSRASACCRLVRAWREMGERAGLLDGGHRFDVTVRRSSLPARRGAAERRSMDDDAPAQDSLRGRRRVPAVERRPTGQRMIGPEVVAMMQQSHFVPGRPTVARAGRAVAAPSRRQADRCHTSEAGVPVRELRHANRRPGPCGSPDRLRERSGQAGRTRHRGQRQPCSPVRAQRNGRLSGSVLCYNRRNRRARPRSASCGRGPVPERHREKRASFTRRTRSTRHRARAPRQAPQRRRAGCGRRRRHARSSRATSGRTPPTPTPPAGAARRGRRQPQRG